MDKYSQQDDRDIASPRTAPGGFGGQGAGSGLINSFVGSIFGKKKNHPSSMSQGAGKSTGGPLKLTY